MANRVQHLRHSDSDRRSSAGFRHSLDFGTQLHKPNPASQGHTIFPLPFNRPTSSSHHLVANSSPSITPANIMHLKTSLFGFLALVVLGKAVLPASLRGLGFGRLG